MGVTEACPFFIKLMMPMNYEKSNLEKALRSPIKKQTIKDNATAGIAIKGGAKGYKKEDGLRPARSFYVVISGGEKRKRLSQIDIKSRPLSAPKNRIHCRSKKLKS